MKTNKGKYLSYLAVAGFAAGVALAALPAFAQAQPGMGMRHGGMPPGVFGTVSSVSGTTLTVTGKAWAKPGAASATAGIAYTVDASNAKIFKNGTTTAVSSIVAGDTVMVQGTVSGNNITATVVRDGMGGFKGMPGMMMGKRGFGWNASSSSSTPKTLPIQGNGEPVIAGSITAISGTTLTVTNASNITYTVDASIAKIVKGGADSSISTLATGDSVVVQGTVNGNSVAATSVIDQSGTTGSGAPAAHSGFLGMIGSFFRRLFGF